jgi:hypothetical protein
LGSFAVALLQLFCSMACCSELGPRGLPHVGARDEADDLGPRGLVAKGPLPTIEFADLVVEPGPTRRPRGSFSKHRNVLEVLNVLGSQKARQLESGRRGSSRNPKRSGSRRHLFGVCVLPVRNPVPTPSVDTYIYIYTSSSSGFSKKQFYRFIWLID